MKSWHRRSLGFLAVLGLPAIASLGACSGADGAIPTAAPGSAAEAPTTNDGGSAVDAPGADANDPPVAVPTAGCKATKAPTGLTSKTITVGGASRRYQLQVPTAYDASRPTRLVFVFHGLGGNGDQIRSYFSFEAEAAGGAIFVYPDGVERLQGRTGWAEDDLGFFDAMVSEISASHCVDAKRIFAAGHSFGGYMSNLVGCERGDVVRAIAPVSGGLVAGTCKGPVAAWLAHGDKDPTVAQSEGISARDHWASANGCSTTTKPTTPAPCVAYDGCSTNHPVTWCSFAGGHYPLPEFTKQAIWDFFQGM